MTADISHVKLCVCLLAVVFHSSYGADSLDIEHGDVTVCDGDQASFNWPCDLQYDLAEVMTLTFYGITSRGQVVAKMLNNGTVMFSSGFEPRGEQRGTSGIYLKDVTILDSGVYRTRAEFANGTVVEREFSVTVLVPPLLAENELSLQMINTSSSCQTITCGRFIFSGFPPVSYILTTPTGSELRNSSQGQDKVTITGCPLLPGNYTCHLDGPAVGCLAKKKDGSAVDLSGVPFLQTLEILAGNVTEAIHPEQSLMELLLLITIPAAAVLCPLFMLGLWILTWMCTWKGRRYKPQLPTSVSADFSHSSGSGKRASSHTALDTQPLTSSIEDPVSEEVEDDGKKEEEEEKEEGKEEEKEEEGGDGVLQGEDNAGQDEADPMLPESNQEEWRMSFVDDADETRI